MSKTALVIFLGVLGAVNCMYGGIPTTVQRHPFMAAIHFEDLFFCAGTIVGDRLVITSAVCIYGLDSEKLTVVAASNDAYNGDVYKVDQLIIHPKYDISTTDYPYALVKTSEPFVWKSKVKAIQLPTEDLTDTTKILVSGWDGGENLSMLQGGMKWMPKDFCNTEFTQAGYTWTDRMACVYNKGKTTLCGNDYGDPIVYKGVLHGVFIWGYPDGHFCTSQAGPLLLADVYPVVDWIKSSME